MRSNSEPAVGPLPPALPGLPAGGASSTVPSSDGVHVLLTSTGMVDIPSRTGGAVESYVWDLAHILSDAGHSITLVSKLRGAPELPPGVRVVSSRSMVDRFPLPAFSSAVAHALGGTFTALATRRAIRGGEARTPTVVHLNEEVSSMFLCRAYRDLPKVFTLHNPPPVGPGLSFGPLESQVRWINSAMSRRWIWRKVDVVIALSSWIRKHLVANGIPPERVHQIPLPIDTQEYLPRRAGPEQTDPYLLYVGRLDARKNVLRLVAAMREANPALRLELVGHGPAEGPIRELIRRRGLERKVSILGSIPQPDLLERFRGATALCLPSTLEAYPRVVVEAAACGVPAILPRTFLYTDFIDHGFVESYDIGARTGLESAIEVLRSDPGRQRELGRRARRFAEGSVSFPSVRSALEGAYRAALDSRAAR